LALLQEDETILKLVVAFWLKSGSSVPDLVAAGVKAQDVFLSAIFSTIDFKVRLKLDAPYNFTERCKP
jgi:hypothetical protein